MRRAILERLSKSNTSLSSMSNRFENSGIAREIHLRSRTRAASFKRQKMNGLGVRDIPIFNYPVRDTPRLERNHGFVGFNRVITPTILGDS